MGLAKLSEVIIIIGLKGQNKCIYAVHVSGEGVEPTHDPSAEGEGIVNPVLRIVFFFSQNGCAP